MKKVLFAIAVGALLVAACNKELENNSDSSDSSYAVIRVNSEEYDLVDEGGKTKATINTSDQIQWAEGDKLGVRLYKGEAITGNDSGSGYGAWDATFTLKESDAGKTIGSFDCPTATDQYLKAYAAWFPRYEDTDKTNIGGDAKLYFYLRSWYDGYTDGACLMPMVADMSSWSESNTDISLKHVGAGVRVTLKDVPAVANQASLTVNGKNITGWYTVDNPSQAGTATITATDGTDNSTVYLKFAESSDKRDMTFIFPLPTVDLSGGITIKLYYDTDHKEFWSRSASNVPVVLGRGEVLDMPDITVPVTPEEAAAPIWIDGKISDWSKASNVTTYSTTSDRIVEWKYTTDSDNIYFLYKINKSKITTSSSSFNWDPYIYVGFDIDNDLSEGYNADGGIGGGMEYRAVIFPWRGPSSTTAECFIGVDENGHIDRMDADKSGTKQGNSKIGGKIDGDYCYVEVRIPFSKIGISSSTGYITVNHAMSYYPTGRQMIAIAGGPKPAIITASDQTVGEGQSVSIGATTTSSGTITYQSNDTSIATVDADGVITGVAEGSTTITMNVAAVGSDFAAGTKTINVTVTEAFTPAIDIDGKFDDWNPSLNSTISGKMATLTGGSHYKELKVAYDDRYIYLYTKRDITSDIWLTTNYIYYGFDLDDEHTTAMNEMAGADAVVLIQPFTASQSLYLNATKLNDSSYSFADIMLDGAVGTDIEFELRILRSDVKNGSKQIVSGNTIRVISWGNKSASDFKTTPLSITISD